MKRIIGLLLVVLTLAISIGSPNVAMASSSQPAGVVEPPPILIPIVFDGVRYEPEEFNSINKSLHAKGIDLVFVIAKGGFYAFSSMDGRNEFAKGFGIPAATDPKSMSSSVPSDKSSSSPTTPTTVYGYYYEHIDYGGARLNVPVPSYVSDLRDYNFNDKISSLIIPTPYFATTLYEDIDYGGSQLEIWWWDNQVPSLVPYGWNDRTSSLTLNEAI